MNYKNFISDIPDFPKKGIIYKDIQPLLAHHVAFESAIKDMGNLLDEIPNYWVGVESRGFLFASALAFHFGGGVRIIRKKGKLPNEEINSVEYGLEYGRDELEMAILPQHDLGSCVIVDDVLATGGTISAAEDLCKLHGLQVTDKLVLVDIGLYNGYDVKSLISYE
jgi:adenine phosphoribosyltransferase|tara:strand:- start:878 stop:1375 length:498 start_codon:yes stop_codon:yes gene_type:complete